MIHYYYLISFFNKKKKRLRCWIYANKLLNTDTPNIRDVESCSTCQSINKYNIALPSYPTYRTYHYFFNYCMLLDHDYLCSTCFENGQFRLKENNITELSYLPPLDIVPQVFEFCKAQLSRAVALFDEC